MLCWRKLNSLKRKPDVSSLKSFANFGNFQVVIEFHFVSVQQSDLDLTRQIVLWLISQRNEAGAFRSTQDTVVGLQALATYQIWVNQVVSTFIVKIKSF